MKLLRLRDVVERTGRPKSGLYADIRDGLMPRPVQIGLRAVAWPSTEIDAVVMARAAGKSGDEIKLLVQKLITQRTQGGVAE